MKKLPLLLLAVAGLVLLSCPSDVEPIPPMNEWDFIMLGGEPGYIVDIPITGDDGFRITDGKKYRVTLKVENVQEDFWGSHLGGKLRSKKEGESAAVLSGWLNPTPDPVCAAGIYRWVFQAGARHSDGQNTVILNPATTPEDATQYFELTAQQNNANWDLWPGNYEFKIKGSISIVEDFSNTATPQNKGELTRDFTGSGHNSDKGIGNIQEEEFQKVKTAAEKNGGDNGSFLRFYMSGVNVSAKAGDEGHGVGSVGNRENFQGANPNPSLPIPKGTTAQNNFSFHVDIDTDILMNFVGAGESHLFVNVFSDFGPAKCDKVELWEYE